MEPMKNATLEVDKRGTPRVALSLPVRYVPLVDSPQLLELLQSTPKDQAQTDNVSESGLSLVCRGAIAQGQLVKVEIDLHGKVVRAFAEAKWCRPVPGSDGMVQVGLGFLALVQQQQQALHEVIAEALSG
jgi:hypothetical protein